MDRTALYLSLLLAFSLAGCSLIRDEQAIEAEAAGTTLAAEVKAQLIKAKVPDAAAIRVEADNGTVVLSGFAGSEAQRQRSTEVARAVDGVTKVINRIEVKQ